MEVLEPVVPMDSGGGCPGRASGDDGATGDSWQAILLVAGDKAGVGQKRFYKALIAKADSRFTKHLKALKET